MKFCYGDVPQDVDFAPEVEGWALVPELSASKMQVGGFPILLVMLLATSSVVRLVSPNGFYPPNLWVGLLGLLLIPVAHELVHALFTPGLGLTDKTVIGALPRKLLLYAYYKEALSLRRFQLVGLAPLLVLSVLPIVLIVVLYQRTVDPGVLSTLGYVAFINAALSYGDVTSLLWVRRGIPDTASVRFNGSRLFWKPAAQNQ
jgi:hypothetical protein